MKDLLQKSKISKVFVAFFVVALIISAITVTGVTLNARAAELEAGTGKCGDNVTYSFDADTGVLTISGTGPMWDWNNISGETHFTNNPFYAQYGIKSVVIEDGITKIGSYAFYVCKNLSSIIIPNSVTSIDEYAFYSCIKLTNVIIPDSVTNIGVAAFRGCMGLTGITIPNGVTSIANYTFYDCTQLQSVTISNNVISIGYSAFENCNSLTSLVIPDSVKNIDFAAFYGCTGLTSLSMPVSARVYNGQYESLISFSKCTNITDLTITAGDGDVINYTDSAMGDTDIYYQYTPWYISRDKLQSITVSNGVKGIGNKIFFGINNIEHITFPESVSSFGVEIFDKANNTLKSAAVHNDGADIGIENLISVMPTGSTLYAYESTGAEPICNNYGVKFISLSNLDCSHIAGEPVIENPVKPTCEAYGSYEEVVYCQICSAELSRTKKTADNPTGHLYVLDSYFDDVLCYRCSYCDDEYYESVFEIKYSYWNIEYCNKPVKTTWYDDSSFCDLVPDGIINAKDYARITQICNEN